MKFATACSVLTVMCFGATNAFVVTNNQHQPRKMITTTLNMISSPGGDNYISNENKKDRRTFLTTALTGAAATLLSPSLSNAASPIQFGDEDLMSQKDHGTTAFPVQQDLLYGVDRKLADRICSYNRHWAEIGGSFLKTSFEDEVLQAKGPITFYDSVTGKPLFKAPLNRSPEEFLTESEVHGWPSFRDEEVIWENVRVLKSSGETVSVDGTHLGHNLPDRKGNRYCINLVSIAGKPSTA